MRKLLAFLPALILAPQLLAATAHAGGVAVLPPSGIGVHDDHLLAAQDLLVSHLRSNKLQAFTVPGEVSKFEVRAGQAIAEAQSAGGDHAAVVHVTRLGNSARIRFSVYPVAGGNPWHDELAAAGPDDIDAVLERMAVGFASGKPARATADIETVTEKEQEPLKKRTATSTWGLKLGMAAPVVDGEMRNMPGASIFWLYDLRSFMAEVDLGFHSGDDASDLYVGINGYYPFSRGNTTPYLGGGLRLQSSDYGASDGGGLALVGGAGILFGRLSSVQLRADLQYMVTTYEVDSYDYYDSGPADRSSGLAHGIVANIGIGF
ncbi:MAG: hypothetical protein KJO07_11995 [Deltaproteobacteria bacterium]|nr:hypothetical protein [Deltaproteobacteria bacterium]